VKTSDEKAAEKRKEREEKAKLFLTLTQKTFQKVFKLYINSFMRKYYQFIYFQIIYREKTVYSMTSHFSLAVNYLLLILTFIPFGTIGEKLFFPLKINYLMSPFRVKTVIKINLKLLTKLFLIKVIKI